MYYCDRGREEVCELSSSTIAFIPTSGLKLRSLVRKDRLGPLLILSTILTSIVGSFLPPKLCLLNSFGNNDKLIGDVEETDF